MKTLQEHEAEFWEGYKSQVAADPKCGISCPLCGEELYEDITQIVSSYPDSPPQHAVVCGKCDWRGSIH